MCIKVYLDGSGNGKGTHVSVFTYLMQGPYDDHLKWPFRRQITIQIVNQAGDHSHFERAIVYDDRAPENAAGRVVGKEVSEGGRGFQKFLALTDLEFSAKRGTQYINDDVVIVRVVSVVFH